MKTIPSALGSHEALGTTSLAHLLKITRKDAQVFAATSSDVDVTLAGVTYRAAPGLDVTSMVTTAGLAVDNLELSTLDDGSTFHAVDVLAGVWRNADFAISRYNWAAPGNGLEVLMVGTIGEVKMERGIITAELRGLQQYLQQPIGSVTSKTCRARLGDTNCKVNLAPYTTTGTVTAFTGKQGFTDLARTEPDGYFSEGILTFTSGLNTGLSQKLKQYTKLFAGAALQLSLPMVQAIAVGDTYTVIAGCRKRAVEDCNSKFANILNFQGEPHLPGIDTLTKGIA